MLNKTDMNTDHPLRTLFRNALEYGANINPIDMIEVAYYIEEQILCEFVNADSFFRIRNAEEERLDDIADMLAEGNVLLNAESFEREYQVHKHIGDYTLFMLGMFPSALTAKKGKEFVLGRIIVPDAPLSDHYILQGMHSYKIASEFTHKELFLELSRNFEKYKTVMELVRTYLKSVENSEFLKKNKIVGGTG